MDGRWNVAWDVVDEGRKEGRKEEWREGGREESRSVITVVIKPLAQLHNRSLAPQPQTDDQKALNTLYIGYSRIK